MDIVCLKCRRSINAPLISFVGKWYCPECGNPLIPGPDATLKITLENYELLSRSDNAYYNGWLPHKNNPNKDNPYKRQKDLEMALYLCKQAAFDKNPYALLSLGYYYENGYDREMTYQMRLNAAELCYRNDVEISKTTKEEFNLGALKDEAMSLLKKVSLKRKENKNSAITAEYCYNIMVEGDNLVNKPAFGLFELSKEEVKALTAMATNVTWDSLLTSSLDLYINLIKNGNLSNYVKISNANTFTRIIDELGENDSAIIAFTPNERHVKLNRISLGDIKSLGNRGEEWWEMWRNFLNKLSSNGIRNCIFNESDMIIAKVRHINSFMLLANYIIEEYMEAQKS